MDVEAIVAVVIENLTDLLHQEPIISSKGINQVELVTVSLRQIQNFLTDAKLDDEVIKKSVEKFIAYVYKVEDAIETFVLRRKKIRRMDFVSRHFFIHNKLKADADLRKEIEEIKNMNEELGLSRTPRSVRESNPGEPVRIQELIVGRSSSQDERRTHNRQNSFRYSVDEELDVIGFREDKKKLVTRLIDPSLPLIPNVISIVGPFGSGKTTLAREIYNSSEIKGHFNCRAWVSATENLSDVYRIIIEQTDESTVHNGSIQEGLEDKLRENLREKRFLVVLDDVRTHDILRGLCIALANETNGSRVMTTAISEDVARSADPPVLLHQLQPLNDEDTWNLFLKKVRLPDNVQFSDPKIQQLREEIINRCKGLPYAIVMLGGLLCTKNASYEEWLKVLEHPSSQPELALIGHNYLPEVPSSPELASRYNVLPFHLRPCLLYLGLFPKGYKIPVRRLLRLWLAEGFVKRSSEMTPEEMVEKYLEELVSQQMIQITTRRKDGSPKTCLMPEELHDVCLSKAEDIGLFHIPQTLSDNDTAASPKFGVRRVAEQGDIKKYTREDSNIQHLRSFLSFHIPEKDTPAKEIGNFLSKVICHRGFGFLRLLDLEHVYKPQLPENLGQLFHLRYLGLRWTFLETLPHSVGELVYLETLDLKHTNISSLPNSIWKMKHLRDLCLNEIRLNGPLQGDRSSLTELQTLWGLFVDKKSALNNGLHRLINLRKLGLTFHLDSAQDLYKWIARLASLQSLRLRSKNEHGPSKLELKPLSRLWNLTHLYLLGNLPELHDRHEFPPALRVLTLSVSKLEKDPMPILAWLPYLSNLRLLADSYTGTEMVCPREGFNALRILKIWMLRDLEKWTLEEGAMQHLQEVEIRCCEKLNELPDKLNLSTLENIFLTNMPNEFANNIPAVHISKIKRRS